MRNDKKRSKCAWVAVLGAAAILFGGCATGPGVVRHSMLENGQLLFVQRGVEAPMRVVQGKQVIRLAPREFSITLPPGSPELRLCASTRPGLFRQLEQLQVSCFAGEAVVPDSEEIVTGWMIHLDSEANKANRFEGLQLTVTRMGPRVDLAGFLPPQPDSEPPRVVYLIAFIDVDRDGITDVGEVEPYVVEVDGLDSYRSDKKTMVLVNEMADAIEAVRSRYIRPVPLSAMVDSAIAAVYDDAGFDVPSGPRSGSGDGEVVEVQRMVDAFNAIEAQVGIVDRRRMWEVAIGRMAEDLDERSTYYTAHRARQLEQGSSDGGGIGVGLRAGRDGVVVDYLFPGSPAARSALQRGDVITAIDGRSTRGASVEEAVKRLRGLTASRVSLRVNRSGVERPMSLVREWLERPHLECRLLAGQTVYLRPYGFTQQGIELFNEQLKQLAVRYPDGPARVILDLRGNPGGLVTGAVNAADRFLGAGLITQLKGRGPEGNWHMMASAEPAPLDWPLTVLVDGQTAAGAELVAAALQDHGRAEIVGSSTRRHGTLQTLYPLSEGIIKLTTHELFRPSGRPLSEGVRPDIPIETGESVELTRVDESPCPGAPKPARPVVVDALLKHALGTSGR